MTHPTRLLRSIALAVALAATVAACSDDDGEDVGTDDPSTTATAGADVELVDEGTLTVCSDTPYEPFEFEGPDGEQTGYDIDILRAIAEDNDLDLEVLDLPFDGILATLAAGDCDVVASAVTINPERAEQVDFSDPYFDADQSLLIRAEDEGAYASLDDLGGQRIAVQAGTTGEAYANENAPDGAEVVAFEDSDALFLAISSNDVAAVLQDFPVNAYRATQDPTLAVTETFPTGEQYGYAVEKDNDSLLSFINDGLAALRDDGRFDTIFAQYFGEAD